MGIQNDWLVENAHKSFDITNGGREEYTADRFSSRSFATSYELMISIGFPNGLRNTRSPYVLLHSIAFNQRCDSGRSKAFPMRGKATGPGGYGSARFRRNVTRQTRTEAATTTATNEICITPRWEWTIGVDAGLTAQFAFILYQVAPSH